MAEVHDRTCLRCGEAFQTLASKLKRGRGHYCSRTCGVAAAAKARWEKHYAELPETFWTWVDQSGGGASCWPWLGRHRMAEGYGRLKVGGKSISAHRLALALTAGEPPASGLFAIHSCDNPPCCNPGHLRWGTPAENTADRRQRGRDASGNGKIDVPELLRLRTEGASYSALADHFSVNQASIGKALKREEKRALLRALQAQPGRHNARDGSSQQISLNPTSGAKTR